MKGQDEHIKSLFSEKLKSHSSPVDPAAWQAVQAGMAKGAAASAGSTGLSLIAKLGLGLLGAGIITAAIIVTTTPNETPAMEFAEEQTVSQELVIDSLTVEPVKDVPEVFTAPPTLNEVKEITTAQGKAENRPTSVEERVYVSEEMDRGRWIKPETTTPTGNTPETVASSAAAENDSVDEPTTSAPACSTADFSAVQHADNPLAFTFSATCDEAESYLWELSDGHVSYSSSFDYEFSNQGNYTVHLTVLLESEESPMHEVEVRAYKKPTVVVPDVFSPNNDIYNPVLDIQALSTNVEVKHLAVYDNFGKLVYETLDGARVWDGNNQYGEACAEGNYVIYYQCVGIDGKAYNDLSTVRLER